MTLGVGFLVQGWVVLLKPISSPKNPPFSISQSFLTPRKQQRVDTAMESLSVVWFFYSQQTSPLVKIFSDLTHSPFLIPQDRFRRSNRNRETVTIRTISTRFVLGYTLYVSMLSLSLMSPLSPSESLTRSIITGDSEFVGGSRAFHSRGRLVTVASDW